MKKRVTGLQEYAVRKAALLNEREKHISETLSSTFQVMCTDEDQPMLMTVLAGFNRFNELTVVAEYYNSEEPDYECSTAAVVNTEDAERMAGRNRVSYRKLPYFIADCMESWGRIVNASLRDARKCFREITDCLIEEGCRFRIDRTYGKNDWFCC